MKSCLSGSNLGDYIFRRSLTCGYESQALWADGFISIQNKSMTKMTVFRITNFGLPASYQHKINIKQIKRYRIF
jgi:hypothetical protein